MTRRHFTALADALRAVTPAEQDYDLADEYYSAVNAWAAACAAVADTCQQFNGPSRRPLFDRPRFLAACGELAAR